MNEVQQLIYNELISKYNFDEWQKSTIEIGLEKNLDVTCFAKPEYDFNQV